MSLLSRIRDIVSKKTPPTTAAPPPTEGSRHDRRAAGRERHHRTGEPAWEASDRIDTPGGSSPNPDAAPEILGGN